MRLGQLLATLADVNSAEATAMARKILTLAHHKRPEPRKSTRRVFPDRRATIHGEPDQRRGPGRRRVSTSEPFPADRRLAQRRVTDVKVFAGDGVELAKCRLRDISVDGAFLETKNFALTEGTNVELVLKIRPGGKPRHCRLPAKVVRVEEDGTAVMFGELDEELCNILLEILKPFK